MNNLETHPYDTPLLFEGNNIDTFLDEEIIDALLESNDIIESNIQNNQEQQQTDNVPAAAVAVATPPFGFSTLPSTPPSTPIECLHGNIVSIQKFMRSPSAKSQQKVYVLKNNLNDNCNPSVTFHPSTTFFGCYWRNRHKNLCGFPSTISGDDYSTWIQNTELRKKHSKTNSNTNKSRKSRKKSYGSQPNTPNTPEKVSSEVNSVVRLCVTIPSFANYTHVVLVGSVLALKNLPETDAQLIGTKISKKQITETNKHAVFQNISMNAMPFANNNNNSSTMGTGNTDDANKTYDANSTNKNAFVVETDLVSSKWTITEHMGNMNAQTKIDMLHKPITSTQMATTSTKLKKYLVTFRVLVLATTAELPLSLPFTDQHEYHVVAAVRSPRFVIGSTQSLSNIRKKKLEKQIGEETISSSSTTPTASETTSTASEGSEEGSESSELSESSESRESAPSVPSYESFLSNTNTMVTLMENQEQVPLPVEQYIIPPVALNNIVLLPSMAHRKRSYEMMSLAARKESDEMHATKPTNATNVTNETQEEKKNEVMVKLESKNKDQYKKQNKDQHEKNIAIAIEIPNTFANSDNKRSSSDFIFNLPYGFARFWALFFGLIVIAELLFCLQINKNGLERSFLGFVPILAGLAGVPMDLFMGVVLFVISFRYQLGLQHIDVKPFITVYRRCFPISILIGFLFLMSQGPWKSQCKSYPCYSSSNHTQKKCDLCIGSLCPQAWGNPAEVSLCRAKPTEEYPILCGHKYCHKSYLDLSMFGILHLDCEGGKQGNYPFFGFPLEEKETGGKVGLSFETAQKNCKAQSWIFPTVFGLGKIILMLYHKYIFDQVENNQKAQRCRLSCVPLLGRCLSQKTSEWVNNRILLNPCLTPIMFLVQSIMIYCFVYY